MRPSNRLVRTTAKFLVALFALSCVARAHPWRSHRHKPQLPTSNSLVTPTGAYHVDNDLVADRVTLESDGFKKTIHIRFGNSRNQRLRFSTASAENGKLVAGDIDRDGDVDLIWVASAASKTAVVLINQGEGDFAEAEDSAPYTSELDGLFNVGDLPDKRLVKRHRKSSSLTSSTFSDIAPGVTSELHVTAVNRLSIIPLERNAERLEFLSNDPERGPPSILS